MTQNFLTKEKGEGQLIYEFTDNNPPISSILIGESSITLAADKRYSKLPPFTKTMGDFENRGREFIDRFEKKVDLSKAIKTIITLSQNIENGADTDYAPLEDTTATRIISDILDKKGKKPSEVGLCEIEDVEKEKASHPSMISTSIYYLHSPVERMSESCTNKGIATFITCKDARGAEKLKQALQKAELAVYENPDKKDTTVFLPSNDVAQVMKALEGTDIIPSFIADEIIAKTKELRPQTAAGADDQMALKEVRTGSKTERATTPKPNTGKG